MDRGQSFYTTTGRLGLLIGRITHESWPTYQLSVFSLGDSVGVILCDCGQDSQEILRIEGGAAMAFALRRCS